MAIRYFTIPATRDEFGTVHYGEDDQIKALSKTKGIINKNFDVKSSFMCIRIYKNETLKHKDAVERDENNIFGPIFWEEQDLDAKQRFIEFQEGHIVKDEAELVTRKAQTNSDKQKMTDDRSDIETRKLSMTGA